MTEHDKQNFIMITRYDDNKKPIALVVISGTNKVNKNENPMTFSQLLGLYEKEVAKETNKEMLDMFEAGEKH